MLLATLAGCTKVSGQGRAGRSPAYLGPPRWVGGSKCSKLQKRRGISAGGAGDALRIYFASEVVRYLIFDDGFL